MNFNTAILESFISHIEKSAILNTSTPNQQDANPDPRNNSVDIGSTGLKSTPKGIENGPDKAQAIKPIKF